MIWLISSKFTFPRSQGTNSLEAAIYINSRKYLDSKDYVKVDINDAIDLISLYAKDKNNEIIIFSAGENQFDSTVIL